MGLLTQSRARVVALWVGLSLLAALAASAPARAVPKPISGKLSKRGYTVVALGANGKVSSVRARGRSFTLRPPARRVTLHLRSASGVYAGPVVVGKQRRGRRAIVGIKAGARLGKVRIRNGYARVSKRLPSRAIAANRWARARKGVPIGARVFGRVRSRLARGRVRGDLDLDGIPEPLDIDDDGDLILDNLDRTPSGSTARSAQATGCGRGNIYCQDVSSGLGGFLYETANANAGSTTEQIDAALRTRGVLRFSVGGRGPIELDCAGDASVGRPGLAYCSAPGTGTASVGGTPGPAFPGPPLGTFDPDGDGFGLLDPTIVPLCGGPCPGDFFIAHGAVARRGGLAPTDSQIGSGDQFLEHVATDGDTAHCPDATNIACVSSTTTLGYVFATTPALVRYRDTAGNEQAVSYPVAGPTPGCPPPACPAGGLGTPGNAFVVAPGPDGNVRVRLTFWRPQRRAIPGSDPATATWMDVGHLTYGMDARPGSFCGQSAFSEDDPSTPEVEDDPNLSPATPHVFLQGGGGFDDAKDDVPSSPGDPSAGRTFSFTLNLTQCLADLGIPFPDELPLELIGAPGAPSSASQLIMFRLPSGITVKNQTVPAESPTTGTEFDFHLVNGPDFKLRHDGTRSFDLSAGNYTVQAFAAPGYDLTAITCDDSDSTGSTTAREANFRVSGGEHVTCTFTNTKQ